MATKLTKSELKSIIRECIKEELSTKQYLKEAKATQYTEADFAWDDAAIVADFKRAALAYMNGADIDTALHDIRAMIEGGLK